MTPGELIIIADLVDTVTKFRNAVCDEMGVPRDDYTQKSILEIIMKTTTTTEHNLSPKQMAEALFNAKPEEFVRVWHELGELTGKAPDGEDRLMAFAEAAMQPNRHNPFGYTNHTLLPVLEKLQRLLMYCQTRCGLESPKELAKQR